jgi:glycerol-3-phosphate dehydrogenase (NAD(P)+)
VGLEHRNSDYLPDLRLPARLEATPSLAEALRHAELVVMAVPSHGFRAILEQAAPLLGRDPRILSLTKGLEAGTLKRMSQVVNDVVPEATVAVLTGPNLAREVVAGQPTASVVVSREPGMAADVQRLLSTDSFRVYTNDDVVGAEVAGALKNVIALAAGMAHGMGLGDNAKAALITRGLAELTRMGVAMGGTPMTFAGLAGMGDLVATCYSDQSRNHRAGELLGRGLSLEAILRSTNMVAEGVRTAPVVLELAAVHAVEMPITEQVVEVLGGHKTARQMIPALMQRQARPEMHGLSEGP